MREWRVCGERIGKVREFGVCGVLREWGVCGVK